MARAAILFEAVWPALWPPLGIVGVFLCAALLDLPPLLPGSLHVAVLALVLLAVVGLLFTGCEIFACRTIAPPTGGWKPALA